ncbi:nitrite reductase [NAD(P)H], large subunit [Gracilibacillus halophilus YIM-C55.5]|uniref:Nitrite reductase [NAD(P)H], large subunit n=1 Tax=Gracilibacillus halophilus YIM-C55.5 TaxID=1308866 RepID=N4WRZ2_9BACI|nr:FAD-dependent oxidoreductase [Gracilibacillus halophilus]ENH97155.1 nitrite reductase [NAD(P)H], large subunit [Gracilibacillus halophilus YIM-C55.5]
MDKEQLILIGNGMAGVHFIEQLLQKDTHNRYQITIFGDEPYTNYSRLMLSSVLQGDTSLEDITLNDWDWYETNQITFYPNEAVTQINRHERTVVSEKGRKISYDYLVIATGSTPVILPVPGIEKQGVTVFRTIDDCKNMMNLAQTHRSATVIGGGLLGLEAARGLVHLGMDVQVVHLSDRIMNKQLDTRAASMLQATLENQGIQFLLNKETKEICGHHHVEGLTFTDGHSLQTDLVIMAVGIQPNVDLAKDAGINVNRALSSMTISRRVMPIFTLLESVQSIIRWSTGS